MFLYGYIFALILIPLESITMELFATDNLIFFADLISMAPAASMVTFLFLLISLSYFVSEVLTSLLKDLMLIPESAETDG